MKKHISIIYVALFCIFSGPVLGNEEALFNPKSREDYTFWATVVGVDKDNHTFRVRPAEGSVLYEEGEVDVSVDTGELGVGYLDRRIRGKLQMDRNPMLLHSIWPWDPDLEAKAKEINAILHYDTLMKPGTKAEKRIGEMMPEFALWNQKAQLITHEDFRGKVVVLNFIYTQCPRPDHCPAATRFMADLQRKAKERGLENVLFVSVSFDPVSDNPGALKQYADAFGVDEDNFYFLTGDPKAIKNLMRQFGIYTAKRDGEFSHTMRTSILNRDSYIIYAETDTTWSVDNFFKRISRLL